jgi:hypothetical protein
MCLFTAARVLSSSSTLSPETRVLKEAAIDFLTTELDRSVPHGQRKFRRSSNSSSSNSNTSRKNRTAVGPPDLFFTTTMASLPHPRRPVMVQAITDVLLALCSNPLSAAQVCNTCPLTASVVTLRLCHLLYEMHCPAAVISSRSPQQQQQGMRQHNLSLHDSKSVMWRISVLALSSAGQQALISSGKWLRVDCIISKEISMIQMIALSSKEGSNDLAICGNNEV